MTTARIIGPAECDQRRYGAINLPPPRRLPFALGLAVGAALGAVAALLVVM